MVFRSPLGDGWLHEIGGRRAVLYLMCGPDLPPSLYQRGSPGDRSPGPFGKQCLLVRPSEANRAFAMSPPWRSRRARPCQPACRRSLNLVLPNLEGVPTHGSLFSLPSAKCTGSDLENASSSCSLARPLCYRDAPEYLHRSIPSPDAEVWPLSRMTVLQEVSGPVVALDKCATR